MITTDIMKQYANKLADIDRAIAMHPSAPLSRHFADWPIDHFGALYLSDLSRFPSLSARLPKMPAPEIQRKFTWWEGRELMRQSVDFARLVVRGYERWVGVALEDATILDYGAGWGRLSRMFLKWVPDERVFACDVLVDAVDLYNSPGFQRSCDLVQTVPVPYDHESVDLVWMFSVLTHLSSTAADAIMRVLTSVVRKYGLLVVTVRPLGFWRTNPLVSDSIDAETLIEQHRLTGFAHSPHPNWPHWGDTSMSLDYMTERWPEWRIVGSEENRTHQVSVFLQRTS